jgi:hypothetical protein
MVLQVFTICTIFASLAFASTAGDGAPLRFPAISGKALNGESFSVPDSLAKANNVLLIAFLREQQEDIDTWLNRLEDLEDEDPSIAVYEFPILPEMNRVSRWFIYQGMRGGITSERARARSVTFHIDKEAFRSALRIDNEDSIQVFLADSSGTVTWRTTGPWSETKHEEMLIFILRKEKP